MPRVLIADDEDSMRSLVARAIAMDGHETVTAEDGAEALDILTREHGTFDLLLTDIQMPVMDGIALALAAARDFPNLKILLMTGFADQRERASGLNAIVHDVVTKPFSVHDIRTAVADALAARKAVSRESVVRGQSEAWHTSIAASFAMQSLGSAQYARFARRTHSRAMMSVKHDALNNPSAAARCNRVRSAGGPDRRDGGAVLRGSGAPAARRSRRGSSPYNRR